MNCNRLTSRTLVCSFLLAAPVLAATHGRLGRPVRNLRGAIDGSACWLELQSHAGCYVWNLNPRPDAIATWSGQCDGQVAQGVSVLTWLTADELTIYEAQIVDGRLHGAAVVRESNGDVWEGFYAVGTRTGFWTGRLSDQSVAEVSYVNDLLHGPAVATEANGTVTRTPYVNGEIHGTVVVRGSDGSVTETPYVNDEIRGTQVRTFANGTVVETPFVSAEIHGTVVLDIRWAGPGRYPNRQHPVG